MSGIGSFLWKISVALYLITNGVLGLGKGGEFANIFGIFGNNAGLFVIVAGVIALIAGIVILLEMFNISVPKLDICIFIIAIIWAVFFVLAVINWITSGFGWGGLATLAVYLMILASLFIASKKFG